MDIVQISPKFRAAIGNDIDLLVGAPADQRTAILRDIMRHAGKIDELSVPLKTHAQIYADLYCENFINSFNELPEKKILFVSARPYFQVLRESMALRKHGYQTGIIYLADVDTELSALISSSFDLALALPSNLLILGEVLAEVQTDLILIQCWMHNSQLPLSRFVIEHKREAKVICEFYDLLTIYSDRAALRQYDPEFADFNFAIDQFVWTHGDAFAVRAPTLAHQDLRSRYGFEAPIIELHPFPSRDFIRSRPIKHWNTKNKPRLVMAGSLMPLSEDGTIPWPRYQAGHGAFTAIQAILDQGLDITVLHDPHKPVNGPDFAYYRRYADSHDNFHLEDGVPPDKLSEKLSEFDFGISLTALVREDVDIRPLHFQTAVGTKLFAYLEGNLPVIVSAEYEYTSHIVVENNLGIAVHTSELGNIADRLAGFDYSACIDSIAEYNEIHAIEIEISRLINLFAQLLEPQDTPEKAKTEL